MTYATLVALGLAAACGPAAVPAPAPVPSAPVPSTPPPSPPRTEAPRADSARAEARPARTEPPARPRPATRTDTLPARALRAPVRVCAGGDVTLGTNLDTAWTRVASTRMRTRFRLRDDPTSLLAPLRPTRVGRGAGARERRVGDRRGAGALEVRCAIDELLRVPRAPGERAGAATICAREGPSSGNVANNHARDAGREGRDSTIAALARAGVVVTGADTIATPVRTAAGDTIGVLGFYTSDSTPDARDTAAVRRLVARAFDRYPAVIVTMHLGAEGRDAQRTTDAPERYLGIDRGNPVAFADAAVRGGAALVIGHGPHVLRAVEWRERGALDRLLAGQPRDVRTVPAARAGESRRGAVRDARPARPRRATRSSGRRCSSRPG